MSYKQLMVMLLKIRIIKMFQWRIYLLLTGGSTIEEITAVGGIVVAIFGIETVDITDGTIIPVRIRLTTVFINGYRPR